MKNIIAKYKNTILVSSFTLLSLLLGFLFLGYKDLSLDEIATAIIVSDWKQMLHILYFSEDNMWLYYFLLHFWQGFGTSEFALRSLSAIFASATVPFIYLLGKKLFNAKAGLLATFLIAINVFFISNAQNARAYSLELLFTTVSSYFFVEYVMMYLKTNKIKKTYVLLSLIFSVLSVYTHFYALFVIASQGLALLILKRKKLIKSLLYVIPLFILGILPIAFIPSIHSGQINWIPVPGIRNLIGTFLILSDDFPPMAVVYIALFIGFFVYLWKKVSIKKFLTTSYWQVHYLFIWLLIPVILSFVFSLLVKPLYLSMYFFICLVPMTLLVSFFLTKVQNKFVQYSIVALLFCLSIVRLYGWYTGSSQLQLVISNTTEDWRGTANFLTQNTKSSDGVLFFPQFVQENTNYYLQKENEFSFINKEITLQPDYYADKKAGQTFDYQKLNSIPRTYQRVWFVSGSYTDSQIDQEGFAINTMLNKNYRVLSTTNFSYITVYLYVKK